MSYLEFRRHLEPVFRAHKAAQAENHVRFTNLSCFVAMLLGHILVLVTIILYGEASAKAQAPQPPGMSFSCSPNPAYLGNPALCTFHAGGGAAGSVTIYYGQPLATLPLDSNGDASVSTGSYISGPGTFLVQAVYSGDNNYGSATIQTAITAYGGKVMVTAETLTCYPYVLFSGNTATCKAHVPGGATGQVAFTVDGAPFASASRGGTIVPLDSNGNSVATNGLAGLAVGSHIVQAIYSGDNNFAGFTTTTAVSISSAKVQPSAMSVGCTPAPVSVGATGSCLITVKGGATGTVTLAIDNQTVGSPIALNTYGFATAANLFSSTSLGSHIVNAYYSGDSNFGPASAATTVSITNGADTPTMLVSCTPALINLGQVTSCVAQLPSGATGNIAFSVGTTAWATAPINAKGAATVNGGLGNLPTGNYTVSAVYAGDSNFTAENAAVNVPVGFTLPQPVANFSCQPATVVAGHPMTCPVTVAGGATGSVELYMDGQLIDGMGLDANGRAVFQNEMTGASQGTHVLGVVYTGDLNFSVFNVPGIYVTVAGQATTPTFSGALTSTSIQSGGQLGLTAQVQQGATGTVSVSINGQPVTQVALNSAGVALASTIVSLPYGTYPVVFNYSGDGNFNPASSTVQLTVSSQAPANPATPTAPIPTIFSLTPGSGAPGTSPITIRGSGFTSTTGTILLNGTSIPVLSWADGQVAFAVPSSAQTGPLIVQVGGVQSNVLTFTVDSPPTSCPVNP